MEQVKPNKFVKGGGKVATKQQKQTKDYVVYFTGVKVFLKNEPIPEDDDYEDIINRARDKMCRGEIENIEGLSLLDRDGNVLSEY